MGNILHIYQGNTKMNQNSLTNVLYSHHEEGQRGEKGTDHPSLRPSSHYTHTRSRGSMRLLFDTVHLLFRNPFTVSEPLDHPPLGIGAMTEYDLWRLER
jgi:hypothetical protein